MRELEESSESLLLQGDTLCEVGLSSSCVLSTVLRVYVFICHDLETGEFLVLRIALCTNSKLLVDSIPLIQLVHGVE